MVSGDHVETCKKVAIDAGIITKDDGNNPNVVMSGEEFQKAIGEYYVEKNEETGEREVKFEE